MKMWIVYIICYIYFTNYIHNVCARPLPKKLSLTRKNQRKQYTATCPDYDIPDPTQKKSMAGEEKRLPHL